MKANYFIWKDENSLDRDIIITKMPTIPKFARKIEKIDVSGRNGTLYYEEEKDVYESASMQIECALLDWEKIKNIRAWLDGESKLILSSMPDKFYTANIVNKFDYTTIANQIGTFPVQFDVQPIAHSTVEKEITIEEATSLELTDSTYLVEPYLKVYGSGDITLYINNSSIVLNDVDEYIELDSETEEAYKDSESCNSNVECVDFPIFYPEQENTISWIGDVEKILIKYREAFI